MRSNLAEGADVFNFRNGMSKADVVGVVVYVIFGIFVSVNKFIVCIFGAFIVCVVYVFVFVFYEIAIMF